MPSTILGTKIQNKNKKQIHFCLKVQASLRQLILSVIGQVQADQTAIIAATADGVRSSIEQSVRQVMSGNGVGATDNQIAQRVQEQMRPVVQQTLG